MSNFGAWCSWRDLRARCYVSIQSGGVCGKERISEISVSSSDPSLLIRHPSPGQNRDPVLKKYVLEHPQQTTVL